MQIFLFIALIIAVLAVLFAVQNTALATVSFAFWKTDAPLALVLLVAVAAGSLISFFVSLPSNLRTRWAIRQQRKKITKHYHGYQNTLYQFQENRKQSKVPVYRFEDCIKSQDKDDPYNDDHQIAGNANTK